MKVLYPFKLHIATPRTGNSIESLQVSAVHSTDHSYCSALYEPLGGLGKEKARLISEIRLEFLPLAGIPVAMLIEGISVVFSWHWNWDNPFTPLEGTRAARVCSLECTDVSSITVYTSSAQGAGNCVCPLTITN